MIYHHVFAEPSESGDEATVSRRVEMTVSLLVLATMTPVSSSAALLAKPEVWPLSEG